MKRLRIVMLLMVILMVVATPAFADDNPALYKSKCAVCHGADGKGQTPMGQKLGMKAFDSPDVAKESDAALIQIIKVGKGKMPSYNGKLIDDQIKGLVKYLRTLK